ncbi:MAG: hypothetical protein ABIF10_00040, partial [Candidatus Woesearchaeota archaeon]
MYVPEWVIDSIVPFMWLLLSVFMALAVLCRKHVRAVFCRVKKVSWLALLLVFLLALVLRLFVFPHQHLMYIDEPWYLEMAA